MGGGEGAVVGLVVGLFVPTSASRQPDTVSANFCSAVARFAALTFTMSKSPAT